MARVTMPGGKLLLVDWGPTAHLLPFAIEHRAEDFFTGHAVEKMLRETGLQPAVEQHPMWYVAEGVKERSERRAPSAENDRERADSDSGRDSEEAS
jgi:predicted GTPase